MPGPRWNVDAQVDDTALQIVGIWALGKWTDTAASIDSATGALCSMILPDSHVDEIRGRALDVARDHLRASEPDHDKVDRFIDAIRADLP